MLSFHIWCNSYQLFSQFYHGLLRVLLLDYYSSDSVGMRILPHQHTPLTFFVHFPSILLVPE